MWNRIYTNDIHVTSDTMKWNFQYKVTHSIIACNYNLKIGKLNLMIPAITVQILM